MFLPLFAFIAIPRMAFTETRSDEELHPWNRLVALGSMDGFGIFFLVGDSAVSGIWLFFYLSVVFIYISNIAFCSCCHTYLYSGLDVRSHISAWYP